MYYTVVHSEALCTIMAGLGGLQLEEGLQKKEKSVTKGSRCCKRENQFNWFNYWNSRGRNLFWRTKDMRCLSPFKTRFFFSFSSFASSPVDEDTDWVVASSKLDANSYNGFTMRQSWHQQVVHPSVKMQCE